MPIIWETIFPNNFLINCLINYVYGIDMANIIIFILLWVSTAAFAEEDQKNEIIQRCKSQMGQYGAVMVKACVDQDVEAFESIKSYPDKHKAVINRCLSQMRQYGYMMVKACADQDIEAQEALDKY